MIFCKRHRIRAQYGISYEEFCALKEKHIESVMVPERVAIGHGLKTGDWVTGPGSKYPEFPPMQVYVVVPDTRLRSVM